MKIEIEKTVKISLTINEAEKLRDAFDEVDSDSIPEWADNILDKFYKPLVDLIGKD